MKRIAAIMLLRKLGVSSPRRLGFGRRRRRRVGAIGRPSQRFDFSGPFFSHRSSSSVVVVDSVSDLDNSTSLNLDRPSSAGVLYGRKEEWMNPARRLRFGRRQNVADLTFRGRFGFFPHDARCKPVMLHHRTFFDGLKSLFSFQEKGEPRAKLEDDYEPLQELGSGRYGTVYVGKRLSSDDDSPVAIKTIPKSRLGNMAELTNEVSLLSKLDHPLVMKLIDTREDKLHYHIVTEMCDGGELFDRIITLGSFSEEMASNLMTQILKAVRHVHNRKIVHRDIKPENLLFKSDSENSALCLIDFGMGREFDPSTDHAMSKVNGSPSYVAPEVLKGSYDHRCDLWSSGIVLYIMLSGVTPFDGDKDTEIMDNVRQGNVRAMEGEYWEHVSEEAKDLVSKLLEMDPEKRLTAHEALQHPWILESVEGRDRPLMRAVENMKQFTQERNFKKAALGIMATMVHEEEGVQRLVKAFQAVDEDGDGLIKAGDIVRALTIARSDDAAHKPSIEEASAIVENIDLDGSGSIDIDEFIASAMQKNFYLQESYLNMVFAKFDQDGNGSITRKELGEALSDKSILWAEAVKSGDKVDAAYRERVLDGIFESADTNNDGIIDFEEFVAVMRDTEKQLDQSLTLSLSRPPPSFAAKGNT